MRTTIFLFLIIIANTLKSQEISVLDFSVYENKITAEEKATKPTIINISTDWCAVCKTQKYKINQDKELASMLNNDFLLVGLNPEKYTKDIKFLGKRYRYYPNGDSGMHELAYKLTEGTNAYPVWIFMDTKGNIIRKIFGLITNDDFKILLTEIQKIK